MPVDYPSREDIRSLCTEQSFERGVNYWRQGRILELDVDGPHIEATVRGSHDYTVSIDVDDGTVRPHCSCPYDYAGECKHVVAVLLAVDDREAEKRDEQGERVTDSVDVEALIAEAPADELRSFLRDAVADDRDLRDRFVVFAGEETGKTVHDYRREIGRLFEDDGFEWDPDVRERLRALVVDCGLARQLPADWSFADIVL